MVVFLQTDNKIGGLQFVPRPAAISAVPLPAGLTEESVTIGSGEFALPGTVTFPAGAGRVPGIVLVHGSGPEDRDETIGPNKPFRDLAWGLSARGIAVLRFEKRTRQYANKLASNLNLTVKEESIDDAISAVQVLQRQSRVDSAHVYVLGHSLGGMLAPRIAQSGKDIAGLIILAGNTRPLPELMIEQLEYIATLSPDSASQKSTLAAMRQQAAKAMDPLLPLNTPISEILGAPAAYWKDLNAYKPSGVAAALKIPMLILQGERDYQVPLKDFEIWRESLKNHPNVTLKSYPELNHLFMAGVGKSTPAEYQNPAHVAEAVIADIASWVNRFGVKSR
jgi:dienelactone hydrolase